MDNLMPAEWAPHQAVWIGFPWDAREWPDTLAMAQEQIAAFANAVYHDGKGEQVYLIAGDQASYERANSLVDEGVVVQLRKIGDSWLRDTGCIIVHHNGQRVAQNFQFNGWGGKYLMPGDQTIGREIAEDAALVVEDCAWVLEGGAIDVDGAGLAVTTEDCLLNPNRNPNMNRDDIEAALRRDLGIDRVLWLGDGLGNDHTDGHVDNLARFVGLGHVLLPKASGGDDPNAAIYVDAAQRAADFGVRISHIPSPGRVIVDGEAVPASYMNFYISNSRVVVPIYGSPHDQEALDILGALFPDREVIGLMSDAVLAGGGSLHCCSQQLPL